MARWRAVSVCAIVKRGVWSVNVSGSLMCTSGSLDLRGEG